MQKSVTCGEQDFVDRAAISLQLNVTNPADNKDEDKPAQAEQCNPVYEHGWKERSIIASKDGKSVVVKS